MKWFELIQHYGKSVIVCDVYHCTERQIKERAERYTSQAAHGIYYTYTEV